MAAGEQQRQAFVGYGSLVHLVLSHRLGDEQWGLGLEGAIASQPIDGPIARRGDQPRARIARDAIARPALCGDGERFLGGLLGYVEVTEKADQEGNDTTPLFAEDLLEQG
jgi:hypothetical protein